MVWSQRLNVRFQKDSRQVPWARPQQLMTQQRHWAASHVAGAKVVQALCGRTFLEDVVRALAHRLRPNPPRPL